MPNSRITLLECLTGSLDHSSIRAALYPEVQDMVRIALRLGPAASLSPDDEDLIAEATYRILDSVCRYRRTFRGRTGKQAYAWLWVVCRRASVREAKRRQVRRRRQVVCEPDVVQALADRGPSARPAPPLLRSEALKLLARAVPNHLWRRMWHLHNRPGFARDCEEIARITGRTPGSVAVTLSRIRSAIRSEMAAALR